MPPVIKREFDLIDAPPMGRTRAESIQAALDSARIEGGTVSDSTQTLLAQWAEGKLTQGELLDAIKKGQMAGYSRKPRG